MIRKDRQQSLNTTTKTNLGLLALSAAALLFYVVQANGMAAQTWMTQDSQDRLSSLLDERNTLVAQQSSMDDRSQLTVLAVHAGMVPAGTVLYLVEPRPVAAR